MEREDKTTEDGARDSKMRDPRNWEQAGVAYLRTTCCEDERGEEWKSRQDSDANLGMPHLPLRPCSPVPSATA